MRVRTQARPTPKARSRFAVAALLALLLPAASLAKAPRPLPAEPTQSLHDAVAAAWDRSPQRQDFAARQAVAAARSVAGHALVPNAPMANGTYVNDRIAGSNYDYITTQLEVSTPVWLPGEGTATVGVAAADANAGSAATEAAHLALAGQVVDLATQAALAANARDLALRRLATNRALAGDLTHRFQTGESSQSDLLAAQAEADSADLDLQTAQAKLAAARLALSAVTGTPLLPRLEAPALPFVAAAAAGDPLASHPRVIAAERAVEAAAANARLVQIADRDDPEIGLQGINEKQPGTRWDTRFGVTVHFHFATEARNAPRRAEAEQAVTQAAVQLALARREVTAGIGQARAILAGADGAAAAAARAAASLETRQGQIERAWKLGEMPLIEVVRSNALAFDAAYARERARTELAAARLQLSLAEGRLP